MRSPKVFLMPVASVILCALPFQLTRLIGQIGGLVYYLIAKTRCQTLATNFTNILYPNNPNSKVIDRYVRKTFENLALCTIDLLQIPRYNRRWYENLVEDHFKENLNRALAQGRGVILVTPHLGNWDLAHVFLSNLGYPLVAVYEPIPGGYIEAQDRYRSRTGTEVVMMDKPIKILRALKKKKILCLLGDRDLTGTGIELDFFAGRRSVPRGPATLALRTGAVLAVGYFVLNPKKGTRPYLAVIEPPIDYKPSGNREQDVDRLTRIVTEHLTRLIRTYPDQWFIFQPDWHRSNSIIEK